MKSKIQFILGAITSFIVVAILLYFAVLLSSEQTRENLGNRFLCSGQPCNVIFILADTLGAKHMGLYGFERDTTPFIDKFFGEQGIVFLNAWSNSTWTLPSFASFYISQYPSSITVGEILKPKTMSFIDVLREAGIRIRAFTPLVPDVEGICDPICLAATGRFKLDEIIRSKDDLQFLDVVQWVQDQKQDSLLSKEPFFLFVHNFIVHSPYNPPESYRTLFDAPLTYPGSVTGGDLRLSNTGKENINPQEVERFQRQYDQELRYFDDLLKDFFEQLPQEVLNTSIIILSADHGEAFGEHGRVGHGGSPYQEELHVPLLMKIPQTQPLIISQPVSLLDIAPTILGMFNLNSPESFLGKSLVSPVKDIDIPKMIVRAETTRGRPLLADFQNLDSTNSIITNQEIAVRLGKWKLIKKLEEILEVYNLDIDPGEQRNLILQWSSLTKIEQSAILPLFHELGLGLPVP